MIEKRIARVIVTKPSECPHQYWHNTGGYSYCSHKAELGMKCDHSPFPERCPLGKYIKPMDIMVFSSPEEFFDHCKNTGDLIIYGLHNYVDQDALKKQIKFLECAIAKFPITSERINAHIVIRGGIK